MKSLLYTMLLLLLLNNTHATAQNKAGANDQIYYQESPGVYRIAKLDGVWAIDETGGLTTHDPEFYVQRKGENFWSAGTFQWLKNLGTDGNIWISRTHVNQKGKPKYNLWLESKRPNGAGDNSSWQFIDWDGNPWTVISIGAKLGVSEICYTLFRGKTDHLFAGKEMQLMR